MPAMYRHVLIRLAVCVGSAAGIAVASMPAAHADAEKVFTWDHDIRAGDCTMFHGARWILHNDGIAEFHALVTSGSDNDAWLMHAALFDANHVYLGNIINDKPPGGDIGKFVINLPSSAVQYPWDMDRDHHNEKTYSPQAFQAVARIELQNHC
ncbi:DUF6294 family protein [Nocardia gamkensis]|uniref:DUF6294 family protein n=2 Tax=Nocardia gamkensis TaxID=352869 RepID=UPI00378AF091